MLLKSKGCVTVAAKLLAEPPNQKGYRGTTLSLICPVLLSAAFPSVEAPDGEDMLVGGAFRLSSESGERERREKIERIIVIQ